jgi:hypothetical protein
MGCALACMLAVGCHVRSPIPPNTKSLISAANARYVRELFRRPVSTINPEALRAEVGTPDAKVRYTTTDLLGGIRMQLKRCAEQVLVGSADLVANIVAVEHGLIKGDGIPCFGKVRRTNGDRFGGQLFSSILYDGETWNSGPADISFAWISCRMIAGIPMPSNCAFLSTTQAMQSCWLRSSREIFS